MERFNRLIVTLLIVVPFLSGCHNNDEPKTDFDYEWTVYEDGTKERNEDNVFYVAMKNGTKLSILSQEWMSYYYDCEDYTNIKNYYTPGRETTTPRKPILIWEIERECSNYTVYLSTRSNMEESLSFETENRSLELSNLFAGVNYYYQILAHFDNYSILSKRYDFYTYDFFRVVSIGGVYNARDLGNKKTNDGEKKVKQGLIYRSANFDSVTKKGIEDAQDLGIKLDLDLREQQETQVSPLGGNVEYVNNGQGEYGSPLYVSTLSGVNVIDYHEPMRKNLQMFTDVNNFPLDFHCAVGRDRTGTLAITLYLLLGIDLDQIKQDYAVSFFSKACNSENFDAYDQSMRALLSYYTHYKANDGSNSGTIYQRTEKYCLDIGLTKTEIQAIRNNLLEKR